MANPGEMTSALLRDPRRWAITLGGLALYGLGSRLWLPGLDPGAATGLNLPALSADLSIFSVGVRPILFGLAFVEMARVVLHPLARWAAGSPGRSELLWRTARIFALARSISQNPPKAAEEFQMRFPCTAMDVHPRDDLAFPRSLPLVSAVVSR